MAAGCCTILIACCKQLHSYLPTCPHLLVQNQPEMCAVWNSSGVSLEGLYIFFQRVVCGVCILRLLGKEKQSVQVRVMGVSGGIKNALLDTFCLFCGKCRTGELPNCAFLEMLKNRKSFSFLGFFFFSPAEIPNVNKKF